MAFAASDAAAAIYNIDFQRTYPNFDHNAENDDTWSPVLTDGVGTAQDDNWNIYAMPQGNLASTTVTVSSLTDTQGSASSISFSSGLVSSDGYPHQTPRDGTWTSWIYTEGSNGETSGANINLTGFAPGASVNLIIYTGNARWSGENGGNFTIGGTTKSYSESMGSNDMGLTAGETYIRFDGLTADGSGNISGTFGNASGDTGQVVFSGMQIQVVPEPSSAILLGLGGLALAFRRKK